MHIPDVTSMNEIHFWRFGGTTKASVYGEKYYSFKRLTYCINRWRKITTHVILSQYLNVWFVNNV